jgi:hypothetical protein
MPMIDVYAPAGTFRDRAKLARDLATAGLAGHAHTNADPVAAARAQLGKK